MAADAYPTRPIRVVDPFSPGGSTEAQARAVGVKLTEAWGQPVVIDARPGAGSSLGSQVVAQAAPDGYTLLVNNVGLVTSAIIAKKPPFDPLKDFAPVIMVGTQPQFIVVHPSLPATLKEFLQYAKANPGKVNYGSSGVGGSSHLSIEYLKMVAGIDVVHVPYKGSAPSATAIMAGEIQLGSFAGNSVLPHIKSGKLRALGTGGLKRNPVLPDVPTVAEAGVPDYEAVNWWGIVAPAGTPPAIVERLHRAITEVQDSAEVQKQFATEGAEVVKKSTAEFGQFMISEMNKWERVVKDGGIKAE
jgi:tripartite-type tricarboxylate transporter receptor subunit TctC